MGSKQPCFRKESSQVGDLVRVKVESVTAHTLIGSMVPALHSKIFCSLDGILGSQLQHVTLI